VFSETSGNAPLAAERLAQAFSTHAVALEKLARQIEKETGWTYMGIDVTPAPLREVSIGAAIEKFTGALATFRRKIRFWRKIGLRRPRIKTTKSPAVNPAGELSI